MALGFGGVGDNIAAKLESMGLTMTFTRGGASPRPAWAGNMSGFTVTLRFKGRQMTSPFYTGSAIGDKFTVADVISSLASGFDDWASDLGFDTDDPRERAKAKATYSRVAKQSERLKQFLQDDLDAVAEVVRDY